MGAVLLDVFVDSLGEGFENMLLKHVDDAEEAVLLSWKMEIEFEGL